MKTIEVTDNEFDAITLFRATKQADGNAKTVSNKRWKAEKGHRYYTVNVKGRVVSNYEYDNTSDQWRYLLGSYFKTQAEAELYRDRTLATQSVLDALREAEGDWVADWDNKEQRKYRTYISEGDLYFDWNTVGMYTPKEWHSSKEAWKQVIKSHADDVWLMVAGERR